MEKNDQSKTLLDSILKGMAEYYSQELSFKIKEGKQKAKQKIQVQNNQVKGAN